jgi:hypothetical protein
VKLVWEHGIRQKKLHLAMAGTLSQHGSILTHGSFYGRRIKARCMRKGTTGLSSQGVLTLCLVQRQIERSLVGVSQSVYLDRLMIIFCHSKGIFAYLEYLIPRA